MLEILRAFWERDYGCKKKPNIVKMIILQSQTIVCLMLIKQNLTKGKYHGSWF